MLTFGFRFNHSAQENIMNKKLDELCDLFIAHCQYERNLSPLTIKAYQIDLRQFRIFIGEQISPQQVGKELIKSYLRHLFEKGLKASSVRRKMICLKSFFYFLECDEILDTSPFQKLRLAIKVPNRIPDVMNLSEIRLLINLSKKALAQTDLVDSHRKDSCSDSDLTAIKKLQDVVILELLFATGMRVGELSMIDIEDIDISRGVIKVNGKGSKQRVLPIPNDEIVRLLEFYSSLRERTSAETHWLLSNRLNRRMSTQSIRTIVRKYVRLAQLKKRVTPHTFRHTTATLLLENGTDISFVQSLLGHRSIATTQLYTHVAEIAQRKAIMQNHPRNSF
jgi:integrase/recombinase XerD